jgi:hypothetical protein
MTELQRIAEETHALANALRQGGHMASAEFYDEVAQRAYEALEIQELTDEYRRAA